MEQATRIAVPISAGDLPALEMQARQALAAGAELLELRVDYLKDLDTDKLRGALACVRALGSVPVLVTCRDPREGGQNGYDSMLRGQVLRTAVAQGADYIDLELENVRDVSLWSLVRQTLNDHARTQLILSSHDFEKPFADLVGRYCQTRAACATAIPKLVYQAHHINDCFPAFDLLHGEGRGAVVLAMGQAGLISRILARKLGAYLTFASLDEARATAPGQLSVTTLRFLYRADTLDRATEVFGVIGDPIAHSKSPALHNACFAWQRMNRVYLPFWIGGGAADLHTFLDRVSQRPWLGLRGFSVTIPHKHAALDYVQQCHGTIEPLVTKIGACNTLMVSWSGDCAHWSAFNTDYSGAMDAIRQALHLKVGELRNWPVAVIGAGGVARALVAGLVDEGAEVTIYNRTVAKAEDLAAAFGCRASGLDGLERLQARLIVNGTSVGMSPNIDDSPVPASSLAGVTAVFDTIYNPSETQLLREARAQGAVGINGVTMFVNQALEQFQLFTGSEGDAAVMEEVLGETLDT